MVQSVLLVDTVVGVAFSCKVAVNARGVTVGGVCVVDVVKLPLQAERIISSKLIPTHVKQLPGRCQKWRLSCRPGREMRRQMSTMPTEEAMNARVDVSVIVRFSLSFQNVVMSSLHDL